MATWRRKRKAQRWGSFAEYSWSTYEEKEDMAIAAYWCFWEIDDSGSGRLLTKPTKTTRSLCVDVDEALRMLRTGERAVVAGGDMVALRERLAAYGVR